MALKVVITVSIVNGWNTLHSRSDERIIAETADDAVLHLINNKTHTEVAKAISELKAVFKTDKKYNPYDFADMVLQKLVEASVGDKVTKAVASKTEALSKAVSAQYSAEAETAKLRCQLEGARGVADDVFHATQGIRMATITHTLEAKSGGTRDEL